MKSFRRSKDKLPILKNPTSSYLTVIFFWFLESTKRLQPAFRTFQNIAQSEQIAKIV